MIEIKAGQIPGNVFEMISKEWMLISAGTPGSFNMMTASWGFMGEMWGRDTFEIVVRSERFTREFIDREGRFVVTFFPPSMREALQAMGTYSGRTFDKMHYAGLQPETLPTGQVTFCGAKLVIECEVVYHDKFDASKFVDKSILDEWYSPQRGGLHERYYGRITRVWVPSV